MYYVRGWAYARKREYDKALADLTEAIRLSPEYADAYNGRAYAYAACKYDKAIADYTEGIRLNPKLAAGYRSRGSVYDNKGDYDKAIADFSEAIRLRPQDAPPHDGMSACLRAKGGIRQGDCRLQRGHSAEPEICRCLLRAGLYLRAEGRI